MQLIASLERGPGSRELSDRVLLALGAVTRKYHEGYKTPWFYYDKKDHMISEDKRPDPSRNLQDAVDLVPADMFGNVTFAGPRVEMAADTCEAELWGLSNEIYTRLYEAEADTSALALCICLLRAAQTKGREE